MTWDQAILATTAVAALLFGYVQRELRKDCERDYDIMRKRLDRRNLKNIRKWNVDRKRRKDAEAAHRRVVEMCRKIWENER